MHCMHSMQDTCFACRSQVWGWLPHCFACSKTVWITAWHTVHSVTLTPLVQLHENERSDHIQQVCGRASPSTATSNEPMKLTASTPTSLASEGRGRPGGGGTVDVETLPPCGSGSTDLSIEVGGNITLGDGPR